MSQASQTEILIISEIYQQEDWFNTEEIKHKLSKLTWIQEKDIQRCLNKLVEAGSVKKSKGLYKFIDNFKTT